MDRNLIPISAKQFREVSKGCGIKYRNKIPSKELKAMLGYRPLGKRRKVEVSLETGFWKTYDTTMEAVEDFKNSHSSAIKYVIDHERPFIKRRMDKKKFWVREILKMFFIERHLRIELAQIRIWISCFEVVPSFCPCFIWNFIRFIWS